MFLIIVIIFSSRAAFADKSLAGIAGFTSNSPRSGTVSEMLEGHINSIMDTSGVFDVINPGLLKEELKKYNCVDEKCINRFARDSGVHVTIMGDIDDLGDRLLISMRAFGSDVPYRGKLVYSYRVAVPVFDGIAAREYSYICEEQAARFLAGMLRAYRKPVFLKKTDGGMVFPEGKDVNGKFVMYRFEGPGDVKNRMKDLSMLYKKTGSVEVRDGAPVKQTALSDIRENDFVFIQYPGTSEFLENFYYGRKKEIALEETTFTDTLYTLLFTVPASATMPLAAPVLGYYKNGDWKGLMLWSVNAAPYLWLEYDGLMNDYADMKGRREDVGRERVARSRFAYYMFFTGGTSLFVDAFSHQYLAEASSYQGKPPLLGSGLSAGYLSLVSGGGGLFYRGYRSWGYLYFHLNNILLYYTLKEFSPGERYNPATGRYERERLDKTRAYRLAGAYALLKGVEITHAVLLKDRVWNGEVIEEDYEVEPFAVLDDNKKLNFGLKYVMRF